MPKLKLTVDKLDEVDEALRPLYVEREGKYELDVDGVPDLRAALKTANREAATLRTKFKDVDLEEVAALREQVEELKTKAGPEALESIKKQMNEAHGKEREKLQKRLDKVRATMEEALVDGEASRALAELKGSPTLLLPHIRKHVKIAESDEGFAIQVVNSKGEPRVRDDGAPVTIKQLVEEMKGAAEFGRAFDGSGAGGTGSGGASGGGGAAKKRSQMTVEQKAAFVAEHGQDVYLKLPF